MVPIRALNEPVPEDCSGSDTEAELRLTAEAEEAIAVSEYMRALELKNSGNLDAALGLFLELLETEVLGKVSHASKDNKLFLVKYNCYRNVGLIYQQRNEYLLALDYLISAVELDESDVHTMYCLAKLALNNNQLEIAKMYYEKCLDLNPNHWPSLDGMLQVFCALENIIEATSWAVHCYRKDSEYQRARKVLCEIRERFASSVPFLEELIVGCPKLNSIDKVQSETPQTSCFPSASCSKPVESEIKPMDFEPFKIQTLNWITLGDLIVRLHTHLECQEIRMFSIDDFLDTDENNNNPGEQTRSSAVYKTSNLASNSEAQNPPRGAELMILEQCAWSKGLRAAWKRIVYDTKSNSVESTADGKFIRRALCRYFIESYDIGISPFSRQKFNAKWDKPQKTNNVIQCSLNEFIQLSKSGFDELIKQLQAQGFDLYLLTYFYLWYLSIYWCKCVPKEVQDKFVQVYHLFDKYEHYKSWNQLADADLGIMFRMDIFYLELQHDANKKVAKRTGNKQQNATQQQPAAAAPAAVAEEK